MKDKTVWWVLGATTGIVLLSSFTMAKADFYTVLSTFIPSVEGFEPHPYWDESRYSWGYGTAAPGPTGTITKDQAFQDMMAYLENDYAVLSPLITRNLNANQWAALMSFSYNEGAGRAKNLVADINSGNDVKLEPHWKAYNIAGGMVDPRLVSRRAKEWNLWIS